MRIKAIFITIGIFALGIGMYNYQSKQSIFPHQRQVYYEEEYSNPPLEGTYKVDENFQSHLPLVIVDTNGEQPKSNSKWDTEQNNYVHINDDPYISGKISIINNEGELNTIKDEPELSSFIKIKLRGYSSLRYDKKQYFIKLVDEEGNKSEQDVLGMGKEWEWVLNISYIDKSLLRNYLCFNIAREVLPFVSDMRFCEVVFKDGEDYEYKGVYLLMESVKSGKGRVDIEKYDALDKFNGYILRRDRYNEKDIMLKTYGTENKLTLSWLELKYPNKVEEGYIQQVTEEISSLEQALFANNEVDYYKYLNYINEQYFIDYFIINEFFANYDAGYYSTYMYKDKGSKIHMGPVWDFDGAMDNYWKKPLKIDSTAMHDAPWFRQILRDTDFVTHLLERYKELRKGVLSDEYILKYIDETVKYLGGARERDWARWGESYTKEHSIPKEDGQNRNTQTYEEEIDKIKFIITSHGAWMDEHLDSLYQFSDFSRMDIEESYLDKIGNVLFGSQKGDLLINLMGIVFIGIFIISIILVQRD